MGLSIKNAATVNKVRRLERVEIHHHEIDAGDLVVAHRLLMAGVGTPRQDATMDRGLQGLHATVHDLREAGVVAHLDHLQPGVAQRLGRAAGRQDFNAVRRQRLAEPDQALLVGDGDQRPFDASEVGGRRGDVAGGGGHGGSFSPHSHWRPLPKWWCYPMSRHLERRIPWD